MSLRRTLRFVLTHPFNRGRPFGSLWRFFWWQMRSRFAGEVVVPWIGGAKLAVRRGMTGATGNVYCGLHEFADMSFVLHFLREDDLFADIGANVGSYTVLASAVCGARVLALEPDPGTAAAFRRNVDLNGVEARVTLEEAAVGSKPGTIAFTTGLDTMNRVARVGEPGTREVRLTTLDTLFAAEVPVLIKLDVEGFEMEVLKGARRVLSEPALLAIETECDEPDVVAALQSHGFERWHYAPESRSLSREDPGLDANNALFLRDPERVAARLREAPARRYRGRLL